MRIHDSYGLFNAVKRIASVTGVTLEAQEGCEQPYTNMKTGKVVVSQVNPYWDLATLRIWLGTAYHEVGHHDDNLKDITPMMEREGISYKGLLGTILNIVEDVRNEKNKLGHFPGRDKALSEVQAHFAEKGAEVLDKTPYDELSDDQKLFSEALGASYVARSEFQPDLKVSSPKYTSQLEGKFFHLKDEFLALSTADDVLALTKKMIDESPEHDFEEEKEKAKEGELSDELQEFVKEMLADRHDEHDEEGEKASPTIRPSDRFYIPWDGMIVKKARDLRRDEPSIMMEAEEAFRSGRMLSSTARRLFQSVSQRKITHNHKSGRLDKRDLYKVPSGGIDVFTRKELSPDPKGTVVLMLTDASSSMKLNKRFSITAAAAALLNNACQPLGVPMKIVAFTERTGGCEHYIIKEYTEVRKSNDILIDYSKVSRKMCQNADGESIMWAGQDLLQRPEPRKLLITLSDGYPCADNKGNLSKYTKDVCQELSKRIELYGIGIEDDSVKDFYPEYTVLNSVSELESTLLSVIKTKIFKL
jgi:hypothetical protein